MSHSNIEMSSFLDELAGEATQKRALDQAQQMGRQERERSVNQALQRTFQFFDPFVRHLNTLQPSIPRDYDFDTQSRFTSPRWNQGLVEYRKQGLEDEALFDHVFFQLRMTLSGPLAVKKRWTEFEETKRQIRQYGLRVLQDLDDIWKSRPQKDVFQFELEGVLLARMRFQADYDAGHVMVTANNLDGFGEAKYLLQPERIQLPLLENIGRYLMGRVATLPPEFVRQVA